MITGEERLRENLADLYGSVVGYEGRPTEAGAARRRARPRARRRPGTSSVDAKELPPINKLLSTRRIPAVGQPER